MENLNTPSYLENTRSDILQLLSRVTPVPSTQIHTGQAGTTLIPDAMDVVTESETGLSSTSGTVEQQRMEDECPDVRPTLRHGGMGQEANAANMDME
jgi:hypothetical protein